MSELSVICEQLTAQQQRLTQQLEAVQCEAAALKAELQKVEAALSALGGKTKPNRRSARSKPAPTREVIRQLVEKLQQQADCSDQQSLGEAVSQELSAAGYSRVGLGLRLKEVFADLAMKDDSRREPSNKEL